jgi:hypothetical protein
MSVGCALRIMSICLSRKEDVKRARRDLRVTRREPAREAKTLCFRRDKLYYVRAEKSDHQNDPNIFLLKTLFQKRRDLDWAELEM